MKVSVSLSCSFVHEPPYQDYSSVLQSRFSSRFFAHGPPHRFPRKSGARSGSPQLWLQFCHRHQQLYQHLHQQNYGVQTKPYTTSPVWKYFVFKIDKKGKVKNDEEVVCQLCSKEVIAKGSNITSSCTPSFLIIKRCKKRNSEKVSRTGMN